MCRHQTFLLGAFLAGLASSLPHLPGQQPVTITRQKIGAQPTSQLKVLRRGVVQTLPEGVASIELKRGEYAAARLNEPVTAIPVGDTVKWRLPIRIQGSNLQGDSLNLRPVVEVGAGLMIDASGEFVGQILIGLEDEQESTRRVLDQTIQMLVTGDAYFIAPAASAIDHTNLPFVPVEIKARNPRDEVAIRVRSEFNLAGSDLTVPVVRPKLSIRASPNSIQGYGLETANLVIQVSGRLPGTSNVVTLGSAKCKPDPAVITTDSRNGIAEAVVRSIGTGSASVTAESQGLASASEELKFTFPWPFVIAATLGGVVGGLIRFLRLKNEPAKHTRYVAPFWHLLLGMAVGLLVSVAYAVGINLLEFNAVAKAGEALVFCTAGLGALSSESLVDKLPGGKRKELPENTPQDSPTVTAKGLLEGRPKDQG